MGYFDMLYEWRMIIAVVIVVCFVAIILWHIISPIVESYKYRKRRSREFEKKCADCDYFHKYMSKDYCMNHMQRTLPHNRTCSDFKERYVSKH
jgi:nucleoside permease NupC